MKKSLLILLAAALVSCATPPPAGDPGAPPPPPPPASQKNLALGKTISSNGHIYDFVAQSAVDGEVLSYFEGPANNYPNVITLDLGDVADVKTQTVKLNPKRIWQARTQTLELQVSPDGTTFTTAVAAQEYSFDPEENRNSVNIEWQGKTRYLRLVVTANTEATGAQIAEWEVFGN